MPLTVRPATSRDEPFLRLMVYEALFVPPGQPPLPLAVLDEPHIAHYWSGFGTRPGDVGRRIAIAPDDEGVGAAWVRQLTGDEPGFGYVDDDIPELTIAVVPEWRGRGVGTQLLAELLPVVPRCSLSVHARNPARRLYERCGFEVVGAAGDSLTMLRSS